MPSCWRARSSRAALAALLLLTGPRLLAAQVSDSLRADSARVRDSIVDETERLLASEGRSRQAVPTIPYLGTDGPRPAGTRWVFTRDSLDWSGHETLGELLTRIPGVALIRGGWVGRTESPNYLGRGPGAVVFLMDGVPWEPLGPDSTQVDPGLIGLNALERVEVMRMPGRLEVHLATRRHGVSAPLSRIGIASGDQDFARYEGLLTQRGGNGLGFGIAAEVLDVPDASINAPYQHTQAWLQASWLPSAEHGVVLQAMSQSVQRDPFPPGATADPLELGLDGQRTDLTLRGFTTRGAVETPTRFDLVLSRSAWSDDDLDQEHFRAALEATHRRAALGFNGRLAGGSGWTNFEVAGGAGWAPGRVAVQVEGTWQGLRNDRTNAWLATSASLALTRSLAVRAEGMLGSMVTAPAVDTLQAHSLANLGGYLHFDQPWLRGEVGVTRIDGPPPLPMLPFGAIVAVADSGPTTWLTANGALTPVNWLTLAGVVSAPLGAEQEGAPPVHGQASLTVRSKFLRTFPSGFFDLKAEVVAEFWGTGTLGTTLSATPIALPSNVLLRAGLEIQLGKFHAFFHRMNLLGTDVGWLPELRYPDFVSTFGVRWDFLN